MASIASPRHASVTAIDSGDRFNAPNGVASGDVLIAFVSSTGTINDATITGGNPWTTIAESHDQFHTIVLATAAGTDNPTTYEVEYDGGSDALVGVLHIHGATLAQILLQAQGGGDLLIDEGVPCPDASPGVAGGVEARYALGFNSTFDIVWNFGQFPEEGQDAESGGLSAYLGARTSLSSADLPVLDIEPLTAFISGWQGWTVIVSPGDTVPPPPPVPSFANRGRSLYRVMAHDIMTGDYIDDLYLKNWEFDKRVLEPGQLTGTIPIPNGRVAAAVRRVIPKLKSDLSTGPGRVEIRIWRDGVLQPRYWLTGARLQRGRDGKIGIQIRASTLDAYWFSVRVRDDRDYQGDQVSNVRSLLQHAQSRPGAFAGVQFQAGTSGVTRPLLVGKDEGTTYGRVASEYARTSGGFEYTVNEAVGDTGVESTWVWGYPKLGAGAEHVFSTSPHGGDIAEYSLDIDALQGGTDWEVRGGTPETDATEEREPVYSAVVTTAHRAAGWPRIDRLINHPTQSTDQGTLDDYAAYWAAQAGGALWVRSVTVFLGKNSTLTMNSLGDHVRMLITDVWHERADGGAGLDVSERVIGMAIRPPMKGRGKEEAVLILESPVA